MRTLLMPLSALAYVAIATIFSVSAADPTATAKPLESPQFLRLRPNEAGGPVALETAIVRYSDRQNQPRQAVHVDLIAAVHIGEREYF